MNKKFEIGLLLPANKHLQKDVELVCVTGLKLTNSKYVDNQHHRHGTWEVSLASFAALSGRL